MYRPPQRMIFNNIPRSFMQPNFQQQNPRAANRIYHAYNPTLPNSYNDNEGYWCETCDRSFPTVNLLEHHKQQHQKCNIDGCQFVAHPKVITKHIQMQHSSGLYKRIPKLDNPEDIKKWREERKKNFPTKSNIEKKAARLTEKTERGEKMGLRYDRGIRHDRNQKNFYSGIQRKHENKQGQHFRNRTVHKLYQTKQISNQPPVKKITKIKEFLQEKRKLKPFTGMQNIVVNDKKEEDLQLANVKILIDDDDSDHVNSCTEKEPLNVHKPVTCSALTSLICSYGSSDEDYIQPSVIHKEDIKIVTPISKNIESLKITVIENINEVNANEMSQCNISIDSKSMIKQDVDNDSGPEETKILKENKNESSHIPTQNRVDNNCIQRKSHEINRGRRNNNPYMRPKSKLPSTLLQKLLHKEIKHERNIMLQCIRHVIKNNYFDGD